MPRAVIESTPEDESTPEYKGGPSRTRGAVDDVESEDDMDVDAEGEDEDAEGEVDEELNVRFPALVTRHFNSLHMEYRRVPHTKSLTPPKTLLRRYIRSSVRNRLAAAVA